MFTGLWKNKDNILYTILTIFLLERVRRGWNRIEERERGHNTDRDRIERKQQTFLFGAALLYALPLLLPTVKYIYRSVEELTRYVAGLEVVTNVWAFALVIVCTQAVLSIIVYNLLGVYVEPMNSVLGFFRKTERGVVDGSRVVMEAARASRSAGDRFVGHTCAALHIVSTQTRAAFHALPHVSRSAGSRIWRTLRRSVIRQEA